MSDLWIALLLLLVLSGLGFWAGGRLTGKLPPRVRWLPSAASTIGLGISHFLLNDSPRVAAWLPVTSLPILGNWLLPFGATLAGCLWKLPGASAVRRLLLVAPLVGLCLFPYVRVLAATPPPCGNFWKDRVCLQSTAGNCGAAAAATLLKAWNMETTESEMARLCRTDASGTSTFGIVRGLRLKTGGSGLKVSSGRATPDQLLHGVPLPAILLVQLSADVDRRDPRYSRDWGWVRGIKHTVVLYGFTAEGKPEIGDPSFGREHWDQQALRDLWTGDYVALKQRR